MSLAPTVHIFEAPHPSPMFVNRSPANRDAILSVLKQVSKRVGAVQSGG
jgi:uracil-DNA glycosylase